MHPSSVLNQTNRRRTGWHRASAAVVVVVALLGVLVAPAAAKKKDTSSTTADATTVSIGDLGSMYHVVDQIGARELWQRGITGAGIDVAVIDTGVAPVPALTGADKVVAMVDLSSEAAIPEAQYLDTNGHGSHMAGIIAGRDPGADPATAADRPGEFLGVAPGAGIVSVKVGDNTGAVDVSQVIAAIDWVVQHRNDGDLNIRVINLSYGTDSTQDYRIDPLARAVENAWDHGIVVVAAAGNEGWTSSGGMSSPAVDPYVIAVAATEHNDWGTTIPSWSSPGDFSTKTKGAGTVKAGKDGYAGRLPDVAAPGSHIVSLRVPGSRVAAEHPEGYVSDSLFRGSGTSQAAAVVSGATALLLEARPELTPDQVKAALMATANPVQGWGEVFQGKGLIDVAEAADAPATNVAQTWEPSTGLGSLEAARGTQHVNIDGAAVQGEITVTGAAWDPQAWIEASTLGSSWTGSSWTGSSWTGSSWTGSSWTGSSWTGSSWTGSSWTGSSWTGSSWTGSSWTGSSWTGSSWTGSSWTGSSWTGSSWTGSSWTGSSWTGSSWTGSSWTGAGWR